MPLTIVRDDLARATADAVVVPANTRLLIDGGAGLAVARVAGLEALRDACREAGSCPVGGAVITPAFGFPAQVIVHAVAPVWKGGWREGRSRRLLASAAASALEAAAEAGAQSVAMPLLGAGTFGAPPDAALEIETEAIRAFLAGHEMDVTLLLYSNECAQAGRDKYPGLAEYIDDVYVGAHGGSAARRGRQHFPEDEEWGYFRASWEEDGAGAAPMSTRPFPESSETGAPLRMPSAPAPSAPAQASAEACAQAPERSVLGQAPVSERPRRRSPFRTRVQEDAAAPSGYEGPADFGAAPGYGAAPVSASRGSSAGAAPASRSAAARSVSRGASPAVASRGATALPTFRRAESLENSLALLDESFAQTVLRLIDERGETDAAVYKRANMSRQLFAKLRKDAGYQPSKRTACALAFALELDLENAQSLLARAGYTLSHSSKFDIIVEWHLLHGCYDVFTVNEALFSFDQQLLG